jgi:hypothetical protein
VGCVLILIYITVRLRLDEWNKRKWRTWIDQMSVDPVMTFMGLFDAWIDTSR